MVTLIYSNSDVRITRLSYSLDSYGIIWYYAYTTFDYDVVYWNKENVTEMKIIYLSYEYSNEICLYILVISNPMLWHQWKRDSLSTSHNLFLSVLKCKTHIKLMKVRLMVSLDECIMFCINQYRNKTSFFSSPNLFANY
jgi:hypothetical protein